MKKKRKAPGHLSEVELWKYVHRNTQYCPESHPQLTEHLKACQTCLQAMKKLETLIPILNVHEMDAQLAYINQLIKD